MNILVDSSIWIDYFRSGLHSGKLDRYIDQNQICTNDLILAEINSIPEGKKTISRYKVTY